MLFGAIEGAVRAIARDAIVAGRNATPVFEVVAQNAGSAIHNTALHVAARAPLVLSAIAQDADAVTITTLHAVQDGVAAALTAAALVLQDTAVVAKFATLQGGDELVRIAGQASEKIRAFYHDNPKVIRGALIGLGVALLLPPVGVLVLNALGWQAGGVAAGSVASLLQSVIYGANTAGLFSILQSIGATATISLPALIAGLGALSIPLGLKIAERSEPAALLAVNGSNVLQLPGSHSESTPLLVGEADSASEEVDVE